MVRVGCSVNMFDEIEMLPPLINNIRQCGVDYINVIYQTVSYTGSIQARVDAGCMLRYMAEKGDIDSWDIFLPDFNAHTSWASKHNEINKRNLGLSFCKQAGCEYFQCRDIDEYFRPREFQDALNTIIQNEYGLTCCMIYIYLLINRQIYRHADIGYITPTWVVYPFMYRISDESEFEKGIVYKFINIDHSREMRSDAVMLLDAPIVTMHHMERVRSDIDRKAISRPCFNLPDSKNDLALYLKKTHEYMPSIDPLYNKKIVLANDEFNILPYINRHLDIKHGF